MSESLTMWCHWQVFDKALWWGNLEEEGEEDMHEYKPQTPCFKHWLLGFLFLFSFLPHTSSSSLIHAVECLAFRSSCKQRKLLSLCSLVVTLHSDFWNEEVVYWNHCWRAVGTHWSYTFAQLTLWGKRCSSVVKHILCIWNVSDLLFSISS